MQIKHRQQVRKGSHGGMQLVLAEDVPNLGKQGDLVEVKAGYGRNYLLPNGLATVPSEHNLRLLERYKERVQQAREARIAIKKLNPIKLKLLEDEVSAAEEAIAEWERRIAEAELIGINPDELIRMKNDLQAGVLALQAEL